MGRLLGDSTCQFNGMIQKNSITKSTAIQQEIIMQEVFQNKINFMVNTERNCSQLFKFLSDAEDAIDNDSAPESLDSLYRNAKEMTVQLHARCLQKSKPVKGSNGITIGITDVNEQRRLSLTQERDTKCNWQSVYS